MFATRTELPHPRIELACVGHGLSGWLDAIEALRQRWVSSMPWLGNVSGCRIIRAILSNGPDPSLKNPDSRR